MAQHATLMLALALHPKCPPVLPVDAPVTVMMTSPVLIPESTTMLPRVHRLPGPYVALPQWVVAQKRPLPTHLTNTRMYYAPPPGAFPREVVTSLIRGLNPTTGTVNPPLAWHHSRRGLTHCQRWKQRYGPP